MYHYAMLILNAIIIFGISWRASLIDSIKISRDIRIPLYKKRIRNLFIALWNFTIISALYYWKISLYYPDMILLFFIYPVEFWILFDLMLNKRRGKSIFYVSNDGLDYDDATSDKIFHKFGRNAGIIQFIVKICIISCLITMFIILIN